LVTDDRARLQLTDFMIEKVVQLQDWMDFHSGVMTIGPTHGDKTTTKTILDRATSVSFVPLRTSSWNESLY
jgi:hypothetical protein